MNNRFENIGFSKVHLSFVLYITAIVLLSIPRGNAQVQLDVGGDGIISGSLGIGLPAPRLKLSIKQPGIVDTRTPVLGIMSNISQRPSIQFSENNNIYGGMSIEYDGTGYGASNKLVLNAVDGSPLFTLFNDGNISVTGKISYVDDPVDTQDAATKAYVDNLLFNFAMSAIIDTSMTVQALLNAGISVVAILNGGIDGSYFIGLNHAGGIIFYIESNGAGLVAASVDQSLLTQWGCYGTDLASVPNVVNYPPSGPGSEIGDGTTNTANILTDCPTAPAALACIEYSGGGYNDWFLPSINELDEMYKKIGPGAAGANRNIGNFVSPYDYWSSTESNAHESWTKYMFGASSSVYLKSYSFKVRAIRAF